MILLMTGQALVILAVFWGLTLTSGGLLILASVALSNADVSAPTLIVGGLAAIAAGRGIRWLSAEPEPADVHKPVPAR